MTYSPTSIVDLMRYWESRGGVSLGIVGNSPFTSGQVARFLAKVSLPDDLSECWLWTGASVRGYGQYHVRRPGIYAHRYSWELFHGRPIPDGLQIDHLCRVIACVNPLHLEAVTQQVNVLRSTSFAADEARRTHCPRGHAYDWVNTYIVRSPGRRPKRQCRPCKAINQRAYKARQGSAA